MGATDLAPYLSQIKRDADAAFIIVVAASALRFPAQYRDAGLTGRLPVIGGGVIVVGSDPPPLREGGLGKGPPPLLHPPLVTPAHPPVLYQVRNQIRQGPSHIL